MFHKIQPMPFHRIAQFIYNRPRFTWDKLFAFQVQSTSGEWYTHSENNNLETIQNTIWDLGFAIPNTVQIVKD